MIKTFKNRRGFTLIELLVVIAIIGILATMITISASYIIQQARIKNQRTTMENSVKTCNAVFLEVNTGFSGINIADVNEFKLRLGNKVKFVENVTGKNVSYSVNEMPDDSMYIYYKFDAEYAKSDPLLQNRTDLEPKYYLYMLVYKVDKMLWTFTVTTGNISNEKIFS